LGSQELKKRDKSQNIIRRDGAAAANPDNSWNPYQYSRLSLFSFENKALKSLLTLAP
jgi:hypothetical protein